MSRRAKLGLYLGISNRMVRDLAGPMVRHMPLVRWLLVPFWLGLLAVFVPLVVGRAALLVVPVPAHPFRQTMLLYAVLVLNVLAVAVLLIGVTSAFTVVVAGCLFVNLLLLIPALSRQPRVAELRHRAVTSVTAAGHKGAISEVGMLTGDGNLGHMLELGARLRQWADDHDTALVAIAIDERLGRLYRRAGFCSPPEAPCALYRLPTTSDPRRTQSSSDSASADSTLEGLRRNRPASLA